MKTKTFIKFGKIMEPSYKILKYFKKDIKEKQIFKLKYILIF